MTRWRIRFEPGALVLRGYPFPRGSRPSRIPAEALSEVCVGWFPPAVRTREGEYLFVPAAQAQELADFASRHGIPFVRRNDVWSFILEEFLDTEFSPELQEGALRYLESNGVSRAETQAMRERVGKRMLALTTLTWEWQHYGLYDVLSAMRPFTFITGGSFSRFYEESMRLADRGGVLPTTREEFSRCFSSQESDGKAS
ncbi:hypothetical protein [Archangium lansingense]|uniref:Uncharacterized protein n=1 Tax=Archangium lansingense TaxID=2995310 RepID=A0ABT4A162_9BACT|nr:hypothetical protein [Archangium lansinium]MCY1075326.1 hypothetical protein [Archangium lansinium]